AEPGDSRLSEDDSVDDGEDVAGGEDEVLLAVVLDLGAAVLAVDHDVADGHVQWHAVALVVDTTRAHRENLALLGLLLGRVGDDDARRRGGLGLAGLNDDLVLERLDVRHLMTSPSWGACRCSDVCASGCGTARRRGCRDVRSSRSEPISTLPVDGDPAVRCQQHVEMSSLALYP